MEIPDDSRRVFLVLPDVLIDNIDTIAADSGLSRNSYLVALLDDILSSRRRANRPAQENNGLLCPRCGGESAVANIRKNKRRRKCLKCDARWSTYEVYDDSRPTAGDE